MPARGILPLLLGLAGGGPHPVGKLTRLGMYGGPRQLYGAFTKGVSPHPVPRITRLGMYGGPRQLYGSFAGKTPGVPDVRSKQRGPFTRSVGRLMGA